ncbi:MAG: LPS export ABC transporter periplasmic protein LptC [Omnitrophica WOR_2 bacterium RBG_13_41_10]|nr:MAG: LPS export ABC transporter periplasmic protein LptC [Omnitrophica WOR_2 bacterium RBG_13_41_10]
MLKKYSLFFILLFTAFFSVDLYAQAVQQDSDQQINDFSLAGFGDKGKKTWDLSAKSADIFPDVVKLKDIIGNLYREQEDIQLTADRGAFDKVNNQVHLEQNVIITTTSGAKLTTDSLDWDRKNQLVTTDDIVNIEREGIITIAQGAKGEPSLNKVTLDKDVTVKINPSEKNSQPQEIEKNRIIITCDGPLQVDYEKNLAKFNDNVKVENNESTIYSDTMEVYFTISDKAKTIKDNAAAGMSNKIDKIVAKGHVRIMRGDNVSYSDEAVYSATDKKITLLGKPRLVIYSTEDMNAAFRN